MYSVQTKVKEGASPTFVSLSRSGAAMRFLPNNLLCCRAFTSARSRGHQQPALYLKDSLHFAHSPSLLFYNPQLVTHSLAIHSFRSLCRFIHGFTSLITYAPFCVSTHFVSLRHFIRSNLNPAPTRESFTSFAFTQLHFPPSFSFLFSLPFSKATLN